MTHGENPQPERLVKSKQRVADHGEVFTPSNIVDAMLDLVKDESERIDARVLEPACGEGAFLQEVLRRKLTTCQARYGKNEFERRHYGLLGLMCTYGIELLEDNAQICRNNLHTIFVDFLGPDAAPEWAQAAQVVLKTNIVQADALTMKLPNGEAITFAEWGYLGKGRFQRRDFLYGDLAKRSAFGEDTLFGNMEIADIFTPTTSFPTMNVADIAVLEA
jgi:type III restriction system methylase